MGFTGSYYLLYSTFVGKEFYGTYGLFIDYVPMYNKFRAVSSILVIAEFTIPLLAVFALKEVLAKPEILKLKENRTGVIITLVLTAGVSLILAVAPGVFFSSYIPAQEMAGSAARTACRVFISDHYESGRNAQGNADFGCMAQFLYYSSRMLLIIPLSAEKVEGFFYYDRYRASVSD